MSVIRATVVVAAVRQDTALGQVANHLLGEKRVTGGPFGNDAPTARRPRIGTQEFIQQRSVSESLSAQALSSERRPRRATDPVLGARADQDRARSLRDHCQKVGKHGLADRIDPVHVLDDESVGSVSANVVVFIQRGQPAVDAASGSISARRCLGVGDAQQIVKEEKSSGSAREPGPATPARADTAIEVVDPGRPATARHHVEGISLAWDSQNVA